ncbi:MAG: DUF6011 domain-containing protein [Sphingopyxis sp.]
MNTTQPTPPKGFDDLDADLDAPVADRFPATVFECRPVSKRSTPKKAEGARFPCEKCRGSGVYTFGYVNRQSGKCHACNGRGYFTRSADDRKASREKAQTKRNAVQVTNATAAARFLEARPDVAAWFKADRSTFAADLQTKLFQYGSLTVGQLTAVENSIARTAKWKADREERLAAEAAATPADALRLTMPEGLYAVPGGETRLKVRIDRPSEGKWSGFVFVKDGAEYGRGTRYGMQKPGSAYQGQIADALAIINADPKAASIAYGKLTGSCGRCGRKLEDANSIEAGIGPICAGKDW